MKFYYESNWLSVIWDQIQCECNKTLNFFILKEWAIASLASPLGTPLGSYFVKILKKINFQLERLAKMIRFLPKKYENVGLCFYFKLNGLSKTPFMFLIDLMIVSQISSKDKIINHWPVINYWQITLCAFLTIEKS